MPGRTSILLLPDEKENAFGGASGAELKSLFNKQKAKRRKSASGLREKSERDVKRPAVDGGEGSTSPTSSLARSLGDLTVQAEWVVHEEGEATSVRAATVVAGARSVRFQTGDGSHLEPPIWGRDPSPESAEAVHRLRVVNKLAGIVRSQLAWLRRILESDRRRNAKLLEQLPRGRRVGFLAKADSAAKVLSCALYEARQLGPMLREPTLRHLLTLDERDARDALAELPQPIIDDLLTLHESHAALRHLLCAAAGAPTQHEEGWLEVVRLVELARELACEDEAHFFPLADLASLRAVLLAQENSVPSLVRLLDWASPQYPLNQRTRARHSAPTPYKPGQPVDDASPSAAIDGVSEAISCA